MHNLADKTKNPNGKVKSFNEKYSIDTLVISFFNITS